MPLADELTRLRRTLATVSDLRSFWQDLFCIDGIADMLAQGTPWNDLDARVQIVRQAAAAVGVEPICLAKGYYVWWPEYGMAHGTLRFEADHAIAADFLYFLDLEMGSFSITSENRPDAFTRFMIVPENRKGRVA